MMEENAEYNFIMGALMIVQMRSLCSNKVRR